LLLGREAGRGPTAVSMSPPAEQFIHTQLGETAAMALAQQTMPVMETMPTHNSQSTEQQLCLGQERYQAQQAWTFMLLVQTLAQRVLDVEQREMRVEQREMEFKQREEQRESYFNQQQRALQQVLKQQKADFIQWERERDQRESDFKQQQREHQQHEKVLKQQGADLIQRETKLEQLETELKQQESALEKAQRQGIGTDTFIVSFEQLQILLIQPLTMDK
jgi:hypothetical protein